VIVLVIHIRLFRMNSSGVGRLVQAQCAWARGRDALGSAVAGKVSLLEDLDEGVLAVALDGACIADAGGRPVIAGLCGSGIACQAGEYGLSQRAEDLGAGFDALKSREWEVSREGVCG
jgi:hypothetical protein